MQFSSSILSFWSRNLNIKITWSEEYDKWVGECISPKLSEYFRQMYATKYGPQLGRYHHIPLVTPFAFQVSWDHCKIQNSTLCFGSDSVSTDWTGRGAGLQSITLCLGTIGIAENQALPMLKIVAAWNFRYSDGTALLVLIESPTCANITVLFSQSRQCLEEFIKSLL